jgi:hypothetical protein
MVNQNNAKCLPGSGALSQSFQEYVTQCSSATDTTRMNNMFTFQSLKGLFESERAQADDLVRSLQNIKTLKKSVFDKNKDITTNKDTIDSQITDLKSELENIHNQIEISNEMFLETISEAPKKVEKIGNFQDLCLGSFFGTFYFLVIVLCVIQYFKSDGSGSLSTVAKIFGLMNAIGLILWAILREVA